ncbi:bacteriocin [Chryseobacterium sp. c4a]|uniref:bacteriocin n=1 Tax=Chryseobacterium sp. c4a TaxID=1573582 RepID=UPI00135A14AD|nr:bacteriocin [Chryseobacterium sp. c4a]
MKKLTKKDLKKINGGFVGYPDDYGNCMPGWYLCPTNVCIFDDGGNKPINPKDSFCFG